MPSLTPEISTMPEEKRLTGAAAGAGAEGGEEGGGDADTGAGGGGTPVEALDAAERAGTTYPAVMSIPCCSALSQRYRETALLLMPVIPSGREIGSPSTPLGSRRWLFGSIRQ